MDKAIGNCLPFDQFHDQRMALEAIHLRNMRMIQRREDLRFALEPRALRDAGRPPDFPGR